MGSVAFAICLVVTLTVGVAVASAPPRVPPEPPLPPFSAIPEAALFYPGSVVLRSGGHGATSESNAERWTELGTDASLAEVQAFYEQAMTDPAWLVGGGSSRIPGTNERQVCAWHNDRVILRVGFWRVSRWQREHPTRPTYATIYSVDVIDRTTERTPPGPCGAVGPD